jgi:PEP-CTERM motif-containing protein
MQRIIAAAGLAAGLGLAAPAEAVVFTVTFDGYVSSGFDADGLFGSAPISGESFTAVYTIDTAPSGRDFDRWTPPISSELLRFGSDTAMTAVLTIDGVSVSVVGNAVAAEIQNWSPIGFDDNVGSVVEGSTGDAATGSAAYLALQITEFEGTDPFTQTWNYTEPPTHVVQSSDELFGSFTYTASAGGVQTEDVDLDLAPTEIIGGGASASIGVPEPASWALMLLGAGFVGAAARRVSSRPSHRRTERG